MRRSFAFVSTLFALILLLPLPVAAETDWSKVVDRLLKSIVYLESEHGACTGFVIDTVKKYVFTAGHCADEDKVWMDLVRADIVAKDTHKDLAIFEVKNLDPARPALKLAEKDPEIGQEVMSAGYGYALEEPFFRKAMVSQTNVNIPEGGIGGPYIGLDSTFVPGQSGGPVINADGEVVMVVQLGSNSVGMGVGASTIRKRMGRFWSGK